MTKMERKAKRSPTKRLKIYKEINGLHWQEMADKLNISLDTVKKWDQIGIPMKKVDFAANTLGFEAWVFTEKELCEERLKLIFTDPEKQQEFRPTSDLDHSGFCKDLISISGTIARPKKEDFQKFENSVTSIPYWFFSKQFSIYKKNIILVAKTTNDSEPGVLKVFLKKYDEKIYPGSDPNFEPDLELDPDLTPDLEPVDFEINPFPYDLSECGFNAFPTLCVRTNKSHSNKVINSEKARVELKETGEYYLYVEAGKGLLDKNPEISFEIKILGE